MRFLPIFFLAVVGAVAGAEIPTDAPQAVDSRLQVALYASDPEIVTPIGAAVDSRGRLFVIESHTHLRPAGYAGPQHDAIKIFEGIRPDGRAEKISVFADDIDEAMNLAFSPDGVLHVCTAKSVMALPDRNGNGRADGSSIVVRLETDQDYPHNQLLGLTFSPDGWLYVTRGNVAGFAYAWVGSDGTRVDGYGEGGDIVRCRPDGSGLERVAQGFWNPFDLRFDRFGRLLCVDNDPDSRGPNRLLQIVPGGDYGYKALYGGSGLHPYDGWEGDLPGTLPIVCAVGEAPSAVLDLNRCAFPADYHDTMAATVWGEHNITLFRTKPVGVSLRATAEPFLQGGKYFRPVALAPAPDGSLFVTDWVLSEYPNHGRGRIWRISTRAGVSTMQPRAAFAPPDPDPAFARFTRIYGASRPEDFDLLRSALSDADPFVRSAAISALGRSVFRKPVEAALESADASVRLGALLALRRAGVAYAGDILKKRLLDSDLQVRQMALIWTGEAVLKNLLPQVEESTSMPGITARFFDTWLATMAILESDVDKLYARKTPGNQIKRNTPQALLEKIVTDGRRPDTLRAFALSRMSNRGGSARNEDLLIRLAGTPAPSLQIEALRQLAGLEGPASSPVLLKVARDRTQASEVRAEALLALGSRADAGILPLLDDPDGAIRIQTARTLRFAIGDPKVRDVVRRKIGGEGQDPAQAEVVSQLKFLLGEKSQTPRSESVEDWQALLSSGGNIEAGGRVFFSPAAICSQCHTIEGRGGRIGPDLSVVGRTANRAQLIHSIVKPSDDIAPQFKGWQVTKKNGETITGLQGHLRTGGTVSIIPIGGVEIRIPGDEVASFGAMDGSLMPEGLPASLSTEEFRDLVAFLESRK